MDDREILKCAGKIFNEEITAIERTAASLGDSFVRSTRLILGRRGKVVTSGLGKSGIIARKIAATLSSTGTRSVFLHAVEGIHGDIGVVSRNDTALFISKSGRNEELVELATSMKMIDVPIISIIADKNSPLAEVSQETLVIEVEREACPMNLAPTSSTTATLVMGDALAGALLEARGFNKEDFARFHPGGALGRRLTLKVAHVMHSGEGVPLIEAEAGMSDTLVEMSSKSMGAVNVLGSDGKLAGIITDGDLRRALSKHPDIMKMQAGEVMTVDPVTVSPDDMAIDAMILMENRPSQIYVLPVVDAERNVVGIIRLHDLVQAGL